MRLLLQISIINMNNINRTSVWNIINDNPTTAANSPLGSIYTWMVFPPCALGYGWQDMKTVETSLDTWGTGRFFRRCGFSCGCSSGPIGCTFWSSEDIWKAALRCELDCGWGGDPLALKWRIKEKGLSNYERKATDGQSLLYSVACPQLKRYTGSRKITF